MKKSKATLILSILFSIHSATAQTNLSLIEDRYARLDSVAYMAGLINAVRRSHYLNNRKPTEGEVNGIYRTIKNGINGHNVKFVLTFDIDTSKLHTDNYLRIEDCYFAFDILCHDGRFNPKYFVYFHKGEVDEFGNTYLTFERKYAKQLESAYKRVLKKRPKHILRTFHLPNALLFVKEDLIFVYRVIQKETYELDDYVAKFKHLKYFYIKSF